MLGKFNRNVDFSDSPNGFFGFLRETFDQLAREEQAAADWEGSDCPDYPSFGHKDDTHDDVVKTFYTSWNGFATRKNFAWKDHWRLSEAPDRRYRRAMEKENQKLRDDGIREFNDAVRTLVAFVRKRDPRYTPNTQSEAERQKALQDAAKAQAAKARAANAAKLQTEAVPEWAKAREPEELQEEEEEEVEEDHYECVACNKTFKSEKQYDAHEKSKKHQKAVQALKKKMRKQNANLDLDDDAPSSGTFTPMEDEDPPVQQDTEMPEEDDEVTAEELAEAMANTGVHKEEADEDYVHVHKDDELEGSDSEEDKPASTHPIAKEQRGSDSDDDSSDEDSDYAPRAKVSDRLTTDTIKDTNEVDNAVESQDSAPSAPKLGKAAQKRAKKAAKQEVADEEILKFKCATCNAAFPSKTRLHQHIKDFNHAAPVSVTKGPSKVRKAGKK
ncbi:hypothetical protein LTS18_003840 [Coniosporium uncinatum]|uniref:Uncharacterized protein n=1 Tax=Coniosporium uncinatum TaxID=93489 RepID=A0ACC3D6B4_9PEZI|nr:hypothetical protein LTS18_003840 [Coniosporium uncinatum]